MNRRDFLTTLSATALATQFAQSQSLPTSINPSLSFSDNPLSAHIPADFIGLSYESAQLANPAFFAPSNKQLIALFRKLSAHGNLRIGGGSSNFTTYSEKPPAMPLPFETFGPDTSKTVKTGTVTSTLALHNLRGFLDAIGWSCLYGLNLGKGTAENASREAAAVHRILGPRLLAFQIGNEPDSFRNRYRPATYTPEDFIAEWNRFHDAIVKATPQARFAGPDISNKLAYLTAFAKEASKHSDIILLTSHYYAMGPAGNPEATIDNLLAPNPRLTTLKSRDLHIIREARETAHLPYRVSEANSCWNGGQPGVSDVFASALWAADYALQCASRGWAGINFHGGGNGIYSPIVGSPGAGFTRRPEFYGIEFVSHLLGARILPASLANASPRLAAYVLEQESNHQLVLINKTPKSAMCSLPSGCSASVHLTLHAPSIDSTTNIQITPSRTPQKDSTIATALPYTATLFHLKFSSKK